MVNRNKRILVIPDLHAPYQHPDAAAFLGALKEKYKPTRVISLGDETDGHAISFHDSDPDLFSAGYELKAAISALEPIYRLFSEVDVLWSNHGSLVLRQALANGLPQDYFKPIGQIMCAPKGWSWHETLNFTLPNDLRVHFRHDLGANALLTSQRLGKSAVGGHRHPQYSIQRWSADNGTVNFALVSGCLIDITSRAFGYNKRDILRPILGASVIIDGQPRLEPMLIGSRSRWLGKLYG